MKGYSQERIPQRLGSPLLSRNGRQPWPARHLKLCASWVRGYRQELLHLGYGFQVPPLSLLLFFHRFSQPLTLFYSTPALSLFLLAKNPPKISVLLETLKKKPFGILSLSCCPSYRPKPRRRHISRPRLKWKTIALSFTRCADFQYSKSIKSKRNNSVPPHSLHVEVTLSHRTSSDLNVRVNFFLLIALCEHVARVEQKLFLLFLSSRHIRTWKIGQESDLRKAMSPRCKIDSTFLQFETYLYSTACPMTPECDVMEVEQMSTIRAEYWF